MTGQRNFGLQNKSGPVSAGGVSTNRSAYATGARRDYLPPLPAGSLNYDADAKSRERAAGWFFAVVISLVFAIPLVLVGIIRLFS